MEQTKDLFLDMIENPGLTLEDLVSVGHTATNSRFLTKDKYENSQRVRDKFTDSDGNFKQDEFDKWYAMASNAYETLSNKDTNIDLLNVTAFNASDITVSPDKRTLNTKPIVTFAPNPDRLSTSIYRIGKTSERERSVSELAQAEKILLNPVEAANDPSKAKWGDSPNDSWWSNFFNTLVLAQWDDDGTHIDPVTGKEVKHSKGDYKLNENGTYYYEDLDGRDIYGKQVLNKMNTITTDGTFWNQYDFFDSDDIREKSFTGSVAKNLALVGSMFIPYVGWGIAGASIATQMVGLSGTLGKMLTGSNSPTFSAMEGWAKSLNRQTAKSEYALQNMLCWENFIDLIGDTTAQLREQRAIFKFAPAMLGKGKYGIQSEHLGANTKSLLGKLAKELSEEVTPNLSPRDLLKSLPNTADPKQAIRKAMGMKDRIIQQAIEPQVKNYLEGYNKLGEQISRAYMIGLTVGDTYGEAKEAGASDFEATLLTMGYAAAENKLLKSELGRWIFPELKAETAGTRAILKKATELPKQIAEKDMKNTLRNAGIKEGRTKLIAEAVANTSLDVRDAGKILGKLDDEGRLAWMKTWFNKGKDIFELQSSILKKTGGSVMAGALSEGVEEVSEELLKDFSTSCFNILKAASGNKDVRMQGFLGDWDWNEALKRYGMSFFGGLMGGGINGAATDYRQFKDISNLTSEKAMEQLVWMERNGEMDKLWDIASKTTLGAKNLSTQLNEDGSFKPGTENDNLDLEVKKALRSLLDLIHNIMNAEGASIDDEGLIGQIMASSPKLQNLDVLGNFRADALATSVTAGRFLKEYNRISAAIVMESMRLKQLSEQVPDSGEPSDQVKSDIKEVKKNLKALQDAKEAILKGERTAEFYRDALFETTYGVSEMFIAPTEVQFMEQRTGKKYSTITEDEKNALREEYAAWSETERSEQIHRLADIFYGVALTTSKAMQDQMDSFVKLKENQLQKIALLNKFSEEKLNALMDLAESNDPDAIGKILDLLINLHQNTGTSLTTPLGLDVKFEDQERYMQQADVLVSGVQLDLGNSRGMAAVLQAVQEDTSLSPIEKRSKIIEAFADNIAGELLNAANEIISTGYVHPEVKRNLLPTLKKLSDYCNNLIDAEPSERTVKKTNADGSTTEDILPAPPELTNEDQDLLAQMSEDLEEAAIKLELLSYTPIQESLRGFAVSLGTDKNVLSLIEGAVKMEEDFTQQADLILLDPEVAEKLYEEALKILQLYRASIVAARTDNADIGNLFGYNKVLNQVASQEKGYVPLAQIDAETAELAMLDVNMAIQRLETVKAISDLNLGNKLNTQNYAAANKSFILYNKFKQVLTNLLNEDDSDAKDVRDSWKGLDELKEAVDKMSKHAELTADKVVDRKLGLSPEERELIEIEQHSLGDAIYDFFVKNSDKLLNTDEAKTKLAKFIKAAKFDFYDKNDGILTQASETIDDGAFFWWMVGKAALKESSFNIVYKDVIKDTIAPIPTQELGISAAIAAIYNGELFTRFGQAAKLAIIEDWSSKSEDQRIAIVKQKGLEHELPVKDDDLASLKYSDLVPNYTSILFIEGIPGSGKSTGVFKTIVEILAKTSPEIEPKVKLFDRPIWLGHSTEKNAKDLGDSLNFPKDANILAHDKVSLLSKMSTNYELKEDPTTGEYYYYLGEDCTFTKDGELVSTWEIKKYPPELVPSVIFIDEWSRYTLLEVDLINRFAAEYGITVIAGGDMDQLSPRAFLFKDHTKDPETSKQDPESLELSIARNITPRVPKLGISMRTGNGQKSINLHTLQAYLRSGYKGFIDLRYAKIGLALYGDKVHNVANKELTDTELLNIKLDIDLLVSQLNPDEKIGYIYSDLNSKLYKLLLTEEYKKHIDFKSEAAAQGKEARFYIIENNRDASLEKEAYFKSIYTGISRAEQAAIVIAPQSGVKGIKLTNLSGEEKTLIPDNFTENGVSRFAAQRRTLLNKIYLGAKTEDLNKIKARSKTKTNIKPAHSGPGTTLPSPTSGTTPPSTPPGTPPTGPSSTPPSVPVSTPPSTPPSSPSGGAAATTTTSTVTTTTPEPAPPKSLESNLENLSAIMNCILTKGVPDSSGAIMITTLTLANELSLLESLLVSILNDMKSAEYIDISGNIIIGKDRVNPEVNSFLKACNALVTNKDEDKFLQILMDQFGPEIKNDVVDLLNTTPEDLYAGEEFVNTLFTILMENSNPEPSTEPEPISSPRYKEGDLFRIGDDAKVYSVVSVKILGDSIEYKLQLGTNTCYKSEKYLRLLEEEGFFTDKNDIIHEGTNILPVTPLTIQGLEAYEKLIEEDAELTEPLVDEILELSNHDVDLKVFGHTWNTFYLGVNFDEDSKEPILPKEGEPGYKRIDLANGLLKLDPERKKFKDEASCLQALGTLRKAILYKSNADIVKTIKRVIPSLSNLEISIEWAFISKSKDHKSGDGGRFAVDDSMKLFGMTDEEHSEIPIKSLALLVQDEAGNCVLELPIVTLGSPFTALYKLHKDNPANPIALAYERARTNASNNAEDILNAVIDAIDNEPYTKKAGKIMPGYQTLKDLCKLWQFTSDGIRIIGSIGDEKFNLHLHGINTGNHYVKYRTTENTLGRQENNPYDYSGKWNSLVQEASRPDVNFSSIMLATTDEDENDNFIAKSGSLFVLRSDSDEFTSDEKMMMRYRAQQADPSLEPIVKLEYVSPPEISVSQYLEIEHPKGKDCHYGNEFIDYRILSAILKNDPELFKSILFGKALEIKNLIEQIDAVINTVQKEENESERDFSRRLYREQKRVMDDLKAVHAFSLALFTFTHDYENDVKKPKLDIIAKIQSIINNSTNITGIMYYPVCETKDSAAGAPVGGYGVRIVTGMNKYQTPNNEDFRIYSKYDTPIFNLSILSGYINNWAKCAKKGITTASGITYPNVWSFVESKNGKIISDWQKALYTAEGKTKAGRTMPKNLQLKQKYRLLLAELKLNDYTELDSITDEQLFLQAIVDKYIETPGNIAMLMPGNKVFHGNLNNEGVTSIDKFPEELILCKQVGNFKKTEDLDGSYTITLMSPDGKTLDFLIKVKNDSTFSMVLGQREEEVEIPLAIFSPTKYIEALNAYKASLSIDTPYIDQAIQIMQDLAAAGATKALIALAIKDANPSLIKQTMIARALGEPNFFKILNTEEEQQKLMLKQMCDIVVTKMIMI